MSNPTRSDLLLSEKIRLLKRAKSGDAATEDNRGHGGRVVTLSPPTSAAGVRSPSWP